MTKRKYNIWMQFSLDACGKVISYVLHLFLKETESRNWFLFSPSARNRIILLDDGLDWTNSKYIGALGENLHDLLRGNVRSQKT